MKKSVNISKAALLAIAMAAVLNVSELNAQVRSSASRSRSTAARSSQMDNRNGSTQNHIDSYTSMAGKTSHKVETVKVTNKTVKVGMYPKIAPVPVFTAADLRLRTNASSIVVYTNFFSKAEAYAYVSRLMANRYYDIDAFDKSFGWFNTTMTAIPIPHGWADPFAANQFRIRFDFKRYGAGIKIIVTAQWRESMYGGRMYDLRFQPSDRYSTFYAWNVLEDIAFAIPNYKVSFQ